MHDPFLRSLFDAELTGPNLYIKPCRDCKPAGEEVEVLNPLEIELGWYEPFTHIA